MDKQEKKKRLQRSQLERFLSAMRNLKCELPNKIVDRDRPDFELHFDHFVAGVEITESTHSNFIRAEKLHYEVLRDGVISTSNLDSNDPKTNKALSKSQLLERMSSPQYYWEDFFPSIQRWAERIKFAISSKSEKLHKYQRFDVNWLFISDDPGLEGAEIELGYAVLKSELNDIKAFHFNLVAVITGDFIFVVDREQIYPAQKWRDCLA